jgi:hypothetical protein
MVVMPDEQTAMLQAFDVLAGNPDMHGIKRRFDPPAGDLGRLRNGIDRLFNIGNHAAEHAFRMDFSHPKDFQLAVFILPPGDSADFCGTDVQCHHNF